jgi:DNA polymerase III gamma/tau subunit
MSIEELRKIAEPFSEADLIRFFNSLSETESKLRDATQPRYLLEIGLVKLVEMRRVAPLEQIIERLAKLENALSNGNPNIETSNEDTVKTAAIPTAEKKKLAVDFPPDEVPFPVSEKAVSGFRFQVSGSDDENFPENFENDSKPDFISNEIESADDFSRNENCGIESQSDIQNTEPETLNLKPETQNPRPETNLAEIIANMPSKLPPISSEELEHIEDNKLDDAYEAKLQRLGDDLYPIKNASKIVEVLLGENYDTGVSATIESSNGGAATATAPARQKPIIEIPVFETEDETAPLPELSENPTEEELWHYAQSHPLTKKLIRIFRGKLVEVKKL